ncbi:MAG: radical SAM family heme chaperone HemW [Bdellovibrionales bacterium]
MPISVYLHIPFCLQRCPYCDFSTVINQEDQHQEYVELLKKEIDAFRPILKQRSIDTIYFGGGTPSLLSTEQIHELIVYLHEGKQENIRETTIEINPGTLSPTKLADYLAAGIDRFSLGAQSFDDMLLKKVGRKHSSKDTINDLNLLKSKNLNYSFDLLYSLPTQTIESIEFDLNKIKEFQPPHVSTYYLTIPEKHPLQVNRPKEDVDLRMMDLVNNTLSSDGYDRYEFSNFCRPGLESKHNLSAWMGGEYLGFGMSAHSHLKNGRNSYRFWNEPTWAGYVKRIQKLNLSLNLDDLVEYKGSLLESLTDRDRLNDWVHTSLRLSKGASWEHLRGFPEHLQNDLNKKLKRQAELNCIDLTSDEFRCTQHGWNVLNKVLDQLYV